MHRPIVQYPARLEATQKFTNKPVHGFPSADPVAPRDWSQLATVWISPE